MTRQQRMTNGQVLDSLQTQSKTFNAPIVPVKSEKELLMEAEIAKLKAENEALAKRNAQTAGLTIKQSEKGAVSVYGLGRWPTTLYAEQWLKLFGVADQIKAFIKTHEATLSHKEDR